MKINQMQDMAGSARMRNRRIFFGGRLSLGIASVFLIFNFFIAPRANQEGLVRIAIAPIDTLYARQDYLRQIQAPRAWDIIRESPDVVIAVLDTGVDITHPDLRHNIWVNSAEVPNNGIDDDRNGYIDDYNGWDFVSDSPDPNPKFDPGFTEVGMHHGTIVAGVAAAEGGNGIGVTGVTWSARIMPLRVLSGSGEGDTVAVSQAINYAINNGADIINMSFVGDSPSDTLAGAIADAYQAGVLVIAAAGNEEGDGINMTGNPRYPVCHDGQRNYVIGVTSVDGLDQKTSFSNYGRCVDIAAPGTNIYGTLFESSARLGFSTLYGGGWNGTSLSAPQVAGVAALIKAREPSLSIADWQRKLLNATDNINSANPDYSNQLGSGRLNAFKAVANGVVAQRASSPAPSRAAERLIATGAGPGGGPHVRIFRADGSMVGQFFAADAGFRGGINVALVDIDSDGTLEVIVAPQGESAPWIRIFTTSGTLLQEFTAFEAKFTAGVQLAAGDIDGDGEIEIVVAPNAGGTPQIRIFDTTGRLEHFFFAYHKSFLGGLSLSVGDVNGDGVEEIVVGPGAGSSPLIKVFNGAGGLLYKWIAFEPDYFLGLDVALSGRDIVVSSARGSSPRVLLYTQQGRFLREWQAYDERFQGGLRVESRDLDSDGLPEIVTTPRRGGGPHLRIFNIQGTLKQQWMAYNPAFRGGVSVSVSK